MSDFMDLCLRRQTCRKFNPDKPVEHDKLVRWKALIKWRRLAKLRSKWV